MANYHQRRRNRRFSHEKAMIFGVIQLLCGIGAVVLAAVGIAIQVWGYKFGAGVWSGAGFGVAGLLGISASKRKNNASIVAFMLMSAMAAVLALVLIALSAVGIAFHQNLSGKGGAMVIHSLTIVVGLIEFICGTISSVIGCRASCSDSGSYSSKRYSSPGSALSAAPSDASSRPIYSPPASEPVTVEQSTQRAEPRRGYRRERGRSSGNEREHSSRSNRRSHPDRERSRSSRQNAQADRRHSGQTENLPSSDHTRPVSHSQTVQPSQQITIVTPFPTSDSVYNVPQGAYVMQASHIGGSNFSSVMYVMPPATQATQSRQSVPAEQEELLRPPGTPPPSYSPIDPRLVEAGYNHEESNNGSEPSIPTTDNHSVDNHNSDVVAAVGGVSQDGPPPVPPLPAAREETPPATPPRRHLPTPLPDDVREQQINRRTPLQTVL